MAVGSTPRGDRRRRGPGRPRPSGGDRPPGRAARARPRAAAGDEALNGPVQLSTRHPRAGDLTLRADERAFVTGHGGSGKTTLALRWARSWRAGIAVDHKHELTPADLPGWELVMGFGPALAMWGSEHPRLIVRPVRGDLEPGGPYDRLAERVLLTGRVGWFNDEVHNVAPAGRMQAGFERLWLEGRGRQVPVIAATTRPKHVHNSLLANAVHIVTFRLLLAGDRNKLADTMGDELRDPDLLRTRHSFAHWRSDTSALVVYGPLPAG